MAAADGVNRPEGAGRKPRQQVLDNGTGIKPENLPHVFDPYFTTKTKGTGIGLATVHKIVEAMNGEISVTSREATERHTGETCFSIWLPVAETQGSRS